jgi:hypothetical protein
MIGKNHYTLNSKVSHSNTFFHPLTSLTSLHLKHFIFSSRASIDH